MIRYNTALMFKDFEKHLLIYAGQLQKELMDNIQSGMLTNEGKQDVWAESVKVVAGMVTARVTGGVWATMDEWGTGSLMDRSNPAFARYMQSPFFFHGRIKQNLARVGRPKGQYRDIFGKLRVSSGGLHDINLETLAKRGTLPATFLPTSPSHAFRNAINWMKQRRFREVLQIAVSTFPWYRYLEVTNTKMAP